MKQMSFGNLSRKYWQSSSFVWPAISRTAGEISKKWLVLFLIARIRSLTE